MNYLAHLYLSEKSPESIIGSLLGDFVKGAVGDRYPNEIRRGIELHRKIDRYTDDHETVRASKTVVSPARRRFAGIMVDMFYDHLLAKNWPEYSNVPLKDFSRRVYEILIENREMLPDSLKRILPHMVEHDWLTSYREICNIDRALNGISGRLRYENGLRNSAEELERNYLLFEKHFKIFFPDLIEYVRLHRKQRTFAAENTEKE